jgi:prepilin-type N-terminal cleavage/methylation domain-containing protein
MSLSSRESTVAAVAGVVNHSLRRHRVGGGASIRKRTRRGFSLLELEVAMVVLGVALSGLLPLVIMQSRVLESLDKRYVGSGGRYLVASNDLWVKKLGAAATLAQQDPGAPVPPVLIGDDGDDGYSGTGDWIAESSTLAFQGDQRRHAAAQNSADTAVWAFSNIPAGWYRVEATWIAAADQAADAPYTIYDNQTLIDSLRINQQNAPNGDVYQGRTWQVLGTEFFGSGSIQLRLGVSATGYVVADSIRLVPLVNDIQVLSLQRSLDSEAVTAHVSIDVKVPTR